MAINPYDTYLNVRGLGSFQQLINDLAGYRTKMQPMNYANILGMSPQIYVPEGGLPAVTIAEGMQTTNVVPEQNIIEQGIASLPQVAPAQKVMTLATPEPEPTPAPKPTPKPTPKPAPTLQELLKNIGIGSSYINMYTQPRFFKTNSGNDGGLQDGKELGEQYPNKGRPSFLGFTGDLSAQTGRTIRDQASGGDYDIQRPETYRDVLNAYNRSQYGQD